jgi:enoyl-CoA hydratase/carnithine racemase
MGGGGQPDGAAGRAAVSRGESMESYDYDLGTRNLRLERDGPILWCTIDRPNARNALTPAMYFGIKKAVRHVNDPRNDLRALILTGTGDVFAPGGDLGGRSEEGDTPPVEGLTYEILPFVTIRESQAPVISAVNGICQAGGLLCAMMSDIAVCSERSTFRVPELLRGIIDATYAAILPAHVGMAQARDLLLSARKIDAAEALRIGLVSRVVPHEALLAEARKAAVEILQTAPECRAHVKRMLNQQYARIDYETMFVSLMSETSEAREGMTAFMEKRQPAWIPAGLEP